MIFIYGKLIKSRQAALETWQIYTRWVNTGTATITFMMSLLFL